MKPLNHILPAILLCVALFNANLAFTQKKDNRQLQLKEAVRSQSYVFKANTARPIGRRPVQLTSQYDLRISKDTITAFLPYFGRAYSATLGSTDGGIKFTSTDFSYISDTTKKGSWIIHIQPNKEVNVRQMILTITTSGSADLQVSSNNRQPISFSGTINSEK